MIGGKPGLLVLLMSFIWIGALSQDDYQGDWSETNDDNTNDFDSDEVEPSAVDKIINSLTELEKAKIKGIAELLQTSLELNSAALQGGAGWAGQVAGSGAAIGQEALEGLTEAAADATNFIAELGSRGIDIFRILPRLYPSIFGNTVDSAMNFAQNGINVLNRLANLGLLGASSSGGAALEYAANLINEGTGAVQSGINGINSWTQERIKSAVDSINNGVELGNGIFKNLIGTLGQGIQLGTGLFTGFGDDGNGRSALNAEVGLNLGSALGNGLGALLGFGSGGRNGGGMSNVMGSLNIGGGSRTSGNGGSGSLGIESNGAGRFGFSGGINGGIKGDTNGRLGYEGGAGTHGISRVGGNIKGGLNFNSAGMIKGGAGDRLSSSGVMAASGGEFGMGGKGNGGSSIHVGGTGSLGGGAGRVGSNGGLLYIFSPDGRLPSGFNYGSHMGSVGATSFGSEREGGIRGTGGGRGGGNFNYGSGAEAGFSVGSGGMVEGGGRGSLNYGSGVEGGMHSGIGMGHGFTIGANEEYEGAGGRGGNGRLSVGVGTSSGGLGNAMGNLIGSMEGSLAGNGDAGVGGSARGGAGLGIKVGIPGFGAALTLG